MSGAALDVLECFVSGMDDVVYEIAEQIARQRDPTAQTGGPVQIEVDDMKRAAQVVLQGVREAIASGQLPPSFKPTLQHIQECCQVKCGKL